MRIFLSSLAAFMMLLSLMACGFQLRGSGELDLVVESIYLSAENTRSEFSRELEALFDSQGVKRVEKIDAQYSIHISSERNTRRPVASSANIGVAEYEMSMELTFQVAAQSGAILIAATRLVTERIYSFDATSLSGNSAEETLLTKEMRRDIAMQIVRRFSALSRAQQKITVSTDKKVQHLNN